MKLNNQVEANAFLKLVRECKGEVKLTSPFGDVFNLRSNFMQYVATAMMLNSESQNLTLYCSDPEDEAKFKAMFGED